jgi:hypothetical protein
MRIAQGQDLDPLAYRLPVTGIGDGSIIHIRDRRRLSVGHAALDVFQQAILQEPCQDTCQALGMVSSGREHHHLVALLDAPLKKLLGPRNGRLVYRYAPLPPIGIRMEHTIESRQLLF